MTPYAQAGVEDAYQDANIAGVHSKFICVPDSRRIYSAKHSKPITYVRRSQSCVVTIAYPVCPPRGTISPMLPTCWGRRVGPGHVGTKRSSGTKRGSPFRPLTSLVSMRPAVCLSKILVQSNSSNSLQSSRHRPGSVVGHERPRTRSYNVFTCLHTM